MRLLHVVDGVIGLGGRQTYLDELVRRSSALGWGNEVCTIAELGDPSSGLPAVDTSAVVVHAPHGWAAVLDACGNTPVLAWAHNHDAYCPGGMSWYPTTARPCTLHTSAACVANAYRRHCAPRHPVRLAARLSTSRTDLEVAAGLGAVLAGSQYMAGRLRAAGVPPDRVAVLPYFPRWDPPASPPPPWSGGGRPLVFCPTRLHPTKGVELLLDALAAVATPAEVVVAGAGEPAYVEALTRRAAAVAAATGHRVAIVGSTGEELVELYRRSQVVVVPSSWPEPFGLVGLEAMAAGRAVVGFDVGGIGEWLADGEVGRLVPAGDTAALGRALQEVVADAGLAASLGAGGHRRVVEHFSWPAHLDGLASVLGAVAAGSGRG